jgi:hypothetical protein
LAGFYKYVAPVALTLDLRKALSESVLLDWDS